MNFANKVTILLLFIQLQLIAVYGQETAMPSFYLSLNIQHEQI